jgi:mono/diheme cytochrome c family protein
MEIEDATTTSTAWCHSLCLGAATVALVVATWLAPAMATAAGVDLYAGNCAVCHGAQGQGGIGPRVRCRSGILGTVRNGKGSMPAFPAGVLSNADVAAIEGYLQVLCAPATTTTTLPGVTTTLPGVTTTSLPQSTTTTLPPPPPPSTECTTVEECRLMLAGVLPAANGARGTRGRRVARLLARLQRKAERALDRATGTATGPRQDRQYATVQSALARLMAVAEAADAQGKLGVPLEPIDTVATRLLSLLPGPTPGGGAASGVVLYDGNCASCHGVDARGGIGPDIRCRQGIVGTVRNGKGGMPSLPASVLSDADVAAIEDFLTSLCSSGTTTTTTTATTVPGAAPVTTTLPPPGDDDD